MATLKLKKPGAAKPGGRRAPLRGHAGQARPTLAEAQTRRAERATTDQEVLRQRQGERTARDLASPHPADRAAQQRGGVEHGRAPMDRRTGATGPRSSDRNLAAPGREPRKAVPHRAVAQRGGPPPRGGEDPHERRPPREHRPGPLAHHTAELAQHAPGSLRLSKRISELGLASRREADEWIARGWVRVDGRVVSELGSRVLPEQHITVDARARHEQAQRVTVLLNKPVGYVSGQAEDGYEPAWVLVTPERQWRDDHSGTRFVREHLRSLVPAGRLDIDSVGLLVLTQDGRIAKQLIGEDSGIEKEYLVRVASRAGAPLPDASLALLNHGLELDGEALRPAEVSWLNEDQLRFVLHQGKKRQIRRMCEAVGLEVLGLKRVRIGRVMLGDLPPGQWRYLRSDEAF